MPPALLPGALCLLRPCLARRLSPLVPTLAPIPRALCAQDGDTALLRSCLHGYPNIVELLLAQGAVTTTVNKKNKNALILVRCAFTCVNCMCVSVCQEPGVQWGGVGWAMPACMRMCSVVHTN